MLGMASFDQVVAGFWHPDIEHLRLPPLTDELVADAEAKLAVTLPPDLLRLLRIQNGGVVADAWDAFPAEANFYAEDHVPFEYLLGIGPAGGDETLTLLDDERDHDLRLAPHFRGFVERLTTSAAFAE